jgi:type IV pilus assembly protein PilC
MILKLPIFGPLIQKKTLAMFTSSLGTLLHNGVIINQSLEITSHALENDYYEKDLKKITQEVSK